MKEILEDVLAAVRDERLPLPKPCLKCRRPFLVLTRGNVDTFKSRTYKYCSRECFSEYRSSLLESGPLPWTWKGDKVGYWGLHKWVQKVLGKPNKCTSCKTTKAKRFEWANKSGDYKRKVSDWLRLCQKCHKYYDGISSKRPPRYSL